MRIAYMVLKKLYLVPFLFYKLWKAAKDYAGDYMPGFLIAKEISRHAIDAGNIDLEVIGVENVPKEDGFIFYPNHQGLFDVLNFYASCPKPFSVVIKKEASNIFLLKQTLTATGSLAMDRDDIKQSMQVIMEVTKKVNEGKNFLIFPEGTRSRNGNQLLEFKAGSFKAAQKAKCPIVPCALINSFIPFDKPSIRPVKVKLIYLKPLLYEDYKDMKTGEIAAEVKLRIESAIDQYKDE